MGIPGKKSQITLKITEEGLLLKQVAGGLTFIWTFISQKKYRSECFDITAWITNWTASGNRTPGISIISKEYFFVLSAEGQDLLLFDILDSIKQ